MSLIDDLQPKPPGASPTVFEILRTRRDWQTAAPKRADEKKWYAVGFELAPSRDIADPVTPDVPPAMRFWWALGLSHALLKKPSQVPLEQSKPAPEGVSGWKWGLAAGAVAATVGIGLIVASGGKHE